MTVKSSEWFVYLLRCRDNSLYCGITTDLDRRIAKHNSGRGAKYITTSRRPVKLVYFENQPDKSKALRREYRVKQLAKSEKESMVAKWHLENGDYCGKESRD